MVDFVVHSAAQRRRLGCPGAAAGMSQTVSLALLRAQSRVRHFSSYLFGVLYSFYAFFLNIKHSLLSLK